jgi:hypothetical protein
MWFLVLPQKASSTGGGLSLLGTVVEELSGGAFGHDFPAPYHMTTPQLVLNTLKKYRRELGFNDRENLILETKFASLTSIVERRRSFKLGVGSFPSLPIAFDIDYSRMVRVAIEFGPRTRMLYIPTGYLSRLYTFLDGNDDKIAPGSGVDIDKELIVDQLLLTDEYSITFESQSRFNSDFEAKIRSVNTLYGGRVAFSLNRETRRQVLVKVKDGSEYLIAFKTIDWDDLD